MTDDKGHLTIVHSVEPPTASNPSRAPRSAVLIAAGIMIVSTIVAYLFWVIVLIHVLGLAGDVRQSSLASVIYRGHFWDIVRGGVVIVGAGMLTFITWFIALGLAEDS